MSPIPPRFPHPFELRGQVGVLCGTAVICPHVSGWFIASIGLHCTDGSLRQVEPGTEEFRRLSWAIDVQDGERIDAVLCEAVARRVA